MQWSQYYDTHDSDGNPKNPDSSYFKTIQDALDLDNWLNWRKKWLAEKIVQTLPAKGQRKKVNAKELILVFVIMQILKLTQKLKSVSIKKITFIRVLALRMPSK